MEKERLESLIIDYIDGRLTSEERRLVEDELRKNQAARKLHDELVEVMTAMEESASFEPSPVLKENFEKRLKGEMRTSRGRTIYFNTTFFRVAAAVALMIICGGIGFLISENNAKQERLAEMERQMELSRKQLEETKGLMMAMLENDQSASQRIRGVNVAMELPKADEEIVQALFHALHTDRNTNVRVATLEALSKFRDDPDVRKGLIQSLSKISDPMVQIKLIQLLVEMKEKEVVEDLRKIVDDAGTMKAVKDEAYSGILKLT